MKICPKCSQSYTDPLNRYCWDDGTELSPGASDANTVILSIDNLLPHIEATIGKKDQPTCLLFCDLDDFTSINKVYGLKVGDAVLNITEGIISSHFSRSSVYKLRGDEFVITTSSMSEDEMLFYAASCRDKIRDFEWTSIALGLYLDSSWGVAQLKEGESLNECFLREIHGSKQAKKSHNQVVEKGRIRIGENASGGDKVVRGPSALPKHFSREIEKHLS